MMVYGSYTGAPVWAAFDLWGASGRWGGKRGVRRAVCVEDVEECGAFTRKLLHGTGIDVQVLPGIERMHGGRDSALAVLGGNQQQQQQQQSMVMACFSLGRVSGAARKELIDTLWKQVSQLEGRCLMFSYIISHTSYYHIIILSYYHISYVIPTIYVGGGDEHTQHTNTNYTKH
jgi:hypothetical protein